ncbi:hypothetical protein ACFV84_14220 [Kitasatospora sp. NPDC059811]|uniref:hypothetical protein n=1 Tax=Streptomycetaceae TaxID=2062 RepID=UPI000A6DBED3|nr:hypothetical protein [Streptomyces sp. MJM8645]
MMNESGLAGFVAAPNGWRVAIASPGDSQIMVVPLVGWVPIPEDSGSIMSSPLEPVVLFDNPREPTISTVHSTLTGWADRSYVHQVLAPGFEVREMPEGWKTVEYGDD